MTDEQAKGGLPDIDSWWAAAKERDEAAVRRWQQSPEGQAWRDEAVAEYFDKLPPGDEGLCEVYVKTNYPNGVPWSEYGPNWRKRTSAVIAAVLDHQRRRDAEAGWLGPYEVGILRDDLEHSRTRNDRLRRQLDDRNGQIARLRGQLKAAHDEAERLRKDTHEAIIAERDATIAQLQNELEWANAKAESLRRVVERLFGPQYVPVHDTETVTQLREALVAAHKRIDEFTRPKPGKLIYLASPYSHDDAYVRGNRVGEARSAARDLTRKGHIVFSPIATSGVMVSLGVRPWNDPWWYEWSKAFLARADECWVLTLDGWAESAGVENEMEYASEHGMPVRYVDPKTLEVRDEP